MTDTTNVAFNSLSNDYFLDTFRLSPTCNKAGSHSRQYEANISDECNVSAPEFDYKFDSNDPIQNPSCVYLTQNQYRHCIMNTNDDTLSLLHLNIRSINKNSDSLQLVLDNSKHKSPSVIGLTETWLSCDSSQSFSLPDFHLIANNRQNRPGGGVGLYISDKYHYIVHEQLNCMDDIVESLFIELINSNGKKILIGVIYRPPRPILTIL